MGIDGIGLVDDVNVIRNVGGIVTNVYACNARNWGDDNEHG